MADNTNSSFSIQSVSDNTGSTGLRIVRINILDEQGEAIEEVDSYTSSNAVLFDDGKNLAEKIEDVTEYTNTKKSTIAVGGLAAGTSFTEKQFTEILTDMLYPYVPPEVHMTTTLSKYYELGTTISVIPFALEVVKRSDNISKASLYKDNVFVADFKNLPIDGGSDSYNYNIGINSSTTFSARVIDEKNTITKSEDIIFIFNNPIYAGVITSVAELTDLTIKSGAKYLEYNNINAIDISPILSPNNQCLFFAYKSYTGDPELVEVYDNNGLNITSSFESSTLLVTNVRGDSILYTCWVSNATTQNNFKLSIKIRK